MNKNANDLNVSGEGESLAPGQREQQIEQREAFLETKHCIGCAHEGMMVTSLDGAILEVTSAAEHILNAPCLTLKGRSIRELCAVPDAYNEICRQAIRDGRILNRSILMFAGTELGKLVNLSIQISGIGDDRKLVHVFQDCADLRTMEERLLQSERLATIGRFASQIAHEIRNPLNSISLNVELLEDEVSTGEGHGLIRSIMKELDRLNNIVGEYLQFSRFPKPHLKLGRIERTVRELADSFKPADNISFRVRLAGVTPEVWLDEGLLRQVLDNLTRNASEAITGSGTVEVETDVIDHYVVIRVKDSGAGIPPESQSRLFEPFFTTKAQGTGLGLATSQQIIFEHNGHILVESEPGKGSIFSIFLPI